jgi:monovalent cation/hydrogen antiporter
VLAAVTAGLYVGWRAPELASASTRLLGFSFWEVLVYLLNALLFVLLGLQLRPIVAGVSERPALALVGLPALVAAVVIAVRIVWQFTVPYLLRVLDRRGSEPARQVPPRELLVVGWSGMRGAVSLAAALALPFETAAGDAFPERSLLVLMTFGVIFATLVGQGLTLPGLIRRLKVCGDDAEEQEDVRARLGATHAALARLDELAGEHWVREDTVERLRAFYEFRRRRLSARAGFDPDHGYEERSLAYQRLARELLDAQRRAIVRLRNNGEISSDVMRRVERDLDLEDSRLEI